MSITGPRPQIVAPDPSLYSSPVVFLHYFSIIASKHLCKTYYVLFKDDGFGVNRIQIVNIHKSRKPYLYDIQDVYTF